MENGVNLVKETICYPWENVKLNVTNPITKKEKNVLDVTKAVRHVQKKESVFLA